MSGRALGRRPGMLRLAVGLLLTGLTLFFLLQEIEWPAVRATLLAADPGWVGLTLVAIFLNVLGKAARWKLLLGPAGRSVPFRSAFGAILIGQMLNTLLPMRVGDLTRAHLVGQQGPGRSFTLGTIVLEKAADLLCYLFLFLLLPLWMPLPAWLADHSRSFLLGGLGLGGALLFVLTQRGGIINGMRWASGWLPTPLRQPILQRLQAALTSLDVLRRRDDALRLLLWSILVWFLAILTNWLLLRALHLSVPAISALLLLLVLQASVSLPAVPATIGIFEYLCVLTLGLFGVARSAAFGYGLLLHLLILLPILGGLLLFWISGFSLRHPTQDHEPSSLVDPA